MRLPQPMPGRMETWRDAQLDTFGPYRVVVVLAVEREEVEPVGIAGRMRHRRRDRGNRTAHVPRHHDDLEPERLYRIFEFLDGFLRRMHRDDRRRRQAVGILAEDIGVVGVEGAAGRPPQFVLADMRRASPAVG